MNRILKCAPSLLLAFAATAATHADTINVPGNYSTIAEAINSANDGDVILIAPGVYYEHNLSTDDKAITIKGTRNSGGILETTVDALLNGTVFDVSNNAGPDTVIQDLVLTGGTGKNLANFNYGGAIYCGLYASPTITGCNITGNKAELGGGIALGYGSETSIINCTISGNTGTGTSSYGGGIWCDEAANANMSGCLISGNTANTAGGLYCVRSNLNIDNCTFTSNTATNGGGIYCKGPNNDSVITNCTISGNTGVGLLCDNSTSTITDCTIEVNSPDNVLLENNSNLIVKSTVVTTGGCCLDGNCIQSTESDCTTIGGTYAGDNVACENANCSLGCSPTDVNQSGQVNIDDLLLVIEDWGETCTP